MNLAKLARTRWLLSALLLAGAALFAVGVATERGGHDDEPGDSVEAEAHNDEATHEEAGASGATAHHDEAVHSDEDETVLGIKLESTPLVVLAVVVSVAFAVATGRANHRLLLLTTAVFAGAFAVLDLAELAHQIEESAAGIAVLAAIIAIVHAAAAFVAEQRRSTTP